MYACKQNDQLGTHTHTRARAHRYKKAIEVKDRMLWEVIQGHKALEGKLEDETTLCAEYGEEMTNWLNLTDKLSREVCVTMCDYVYVCGGVCGVREEDN